MDDINIKILHLHKSKFRARERQIENGIPIQEAFNSGDMDTYHKLMKKTADSDYLTIQYYDRLIRDAGGDIYFYAKLLKDDKGELYLPNYGEKNGNS